MTDASRYPCRGPGVASRAVGGEAVVVHPRENRVYVLNRSASAAWGLADGTRSEAEIAAAAAALVDAEGHQVAADLAVLWDVLAERGLLERSEKRAVTPVGAALPWGQPNGGEPYESPAILSEEVLEVLAAVCSSVRTADPQFGCRGFGSCQIAFN